MLAVLTAPKAVREPLHLADVRKLLSKVRPIVTVDQDGRNEVLLWTSQDPRQSVLFNAHGILYRFNTQVGANGQATTTLSRAERPNKETCVAKLEWAPNGGLGRAQIGKNSMAMADLIRPDSNVNSRKRMFIGPDGSAYAWAPSYQGSTSEIVLQDSRHNVIASFRQTRPQRYNVGDVYGELRLLRNPGAEFVMHPPFMDMIVTTAMLYRYVTLFGL
ncbi:hypothetical protein C8Q78DRAFT_1068627 [Trametes maxima]|nr:hypothetical protein C8Q78DRAFT_1068627 [Trametes maxima]